MSQVRVGLGQFNAVVGDLAGNAEGMRRIYERAIESGVELLVFPELAMCGYPPEDLLLKRDFLQENRTMVEKLAADCGSPLGGKSLRGGTMVVVGFAGSGQGGSYNSAAVLQDGSVKAVYRKNLLPNYGVFDERRYFEPGTEPLVVRLNGMNIAVTICMDIWDIKWLVGFLSRAGKIDVIVNISASPFRLGKIEKRREIIGDCARRFGAAVCYCNLVGGQDELVFDGRSMFADRQGRIAAMAKAFEEDLLIADVAAGTGGIEPAAGRQTAPKNVDALDEVYNALVLGTRDYVRKNGFSKVLVGLSGGIDSAVVAVIAAAALGAENVTGVTMPSKFNSPETVSDAERLAKNLGINFRTVPIGPVLERFNDSLKAVGGWDSKGIAYENLQARIRGTILMSLSNQFNSLVLTTGNKSETAVGYATLYGDTAGGFAVLKDAFKTMVYKLAGHINKINSREIIPAAVISRPPSAELREDQKDTDSLPDYDLLDEILKGYVEQDKSAKQLIKEGLPREVVRRVIRLVDRNEYKRRQSPPGVKITPKAFGRDRRLPITNRYSPWAGAR